MDFCEDAGGRSFRLAGASRPYADHLGKHRKCRLDFTTARSRPWRATPTRRPAPLPMAKAKIVDVVTAVSATEVAVDAVVAVRDRVIAAYEDIMKMPI